MGRRPGGFPRAELAQHRAGGVIYHVHETAVGGAIFQPGMKAGIQLHQFAEMRLAHPALAIRLSRSLAAPKSAKAVSPAQDADRKSTRLNSSHSQISYAVFCLKKKKKKTNHNRR